MLSVEEIIDFFKLENSHAKKELGQNFLINSKTCKSIVDFLDIQQSDSVLEIGPGLGALTGYIIGQPSRFTVVEYDQKFVNFLSKNYEGQNIEIVKNNILKYKDFTFNKVIGNLPYYISSDIIESICLNYVNLEKGVFYPVKEEDGKITGYVNEPAKVPAGTYQLFETDDPEYFKKGVFTNISEDGVFHVGVNSTYKEPSDDGTYTISLENYNNQLTGSLYLKKSLDGWKDAEKTVKTENGKYVEFNTEDLSQYGFKLTAADDILSPDDGSVIVKKVFIAVYANALYGASNDYTISGIGYTKHLCYLSHESIGSI